MVTGRANSLSKTRCLSKTSHQPRVVVRRVTSCNGLPLEMFIRCVAVFRWKCSYLNFDLAVGRSIIELALDRHFHERTTLDACNFLGPKWLRSNVCVRPKTSGEPLQRLTALISGEPLQLSLNQRLTATTLDSTSISTLDSTSAPPLPPQSPLRTQPPRGTLIHRQNLCIPFAGIAANRY